MWERYGRECSKMYLNVYKCEGAQNVLKCYTCNKCARSGLYQNAVQMLSNVKFVNVFKCIQMYNVLKCI